MWAYNLFKHCLRAGDEARPAFLALRQAHRAEGRYYHTWRHTLEVARHVHRTPLRLKHRSVTTLAAFYHDSVYIPGAEDNEQRSAERAEQALQPWLGSAEVALIREYILVTRHHSPQGKDPDLWTLIDADLAILAASWEQYRQYATCIRLEYSAFTDAEFVEGRKAFLRRMLDLRRPLYVAMPEPARQQADGVARQNMSRELRLLETGGI